METTNGLDLSGLATHITRFVRAYLSGSYQQQVFTAFYGASIEGHFLTLTLGSDYNI